MPLSTPVSNVPRDRRRSRVAIATLALALATGCNKSPHGDIAGAELAAAEASRARAVEITERMLQVYRRANSYADHAAYVEESVLRGEGVAHELPYYQISLALKRPNLLHLSFTEAVADAAGKRQGFDIACDGEMLRAVLAEIPDQMVENTAPAAFSFENVLVDPLIRERLDSRTLADVFPQLAMLLDTSDADDDAVFPHDSNPRMLPFEKLDGRDCYRVATSHPEGTRVLWIDSETYALRRMELPVESHRQRIDPDGHYLRLAVRIDFDDVTIDPEISPATFTLAAPAGAHRVRRFVQPTDEATAAASEDEKPTAEDATESGTEEKVATADGATPAATEEDGATAKDAAASGTEEEKVTAADVPAADDAGSESGETTKSQSREEEAEATEEAANDDPPEDVPADK